MAVVPRVKKHLIQEEIDEEKEADDQLDSHRIHIPRGELRPKKVGIFYFSEP